MFAVIKKMGDDQRALEHSTHATREEAQREADATGGTVRAIPDGAKVEDVIFRDTPVVLPVRSKPVNRVKRDCQWIVATAIKDGRVTKFLPFETEGEAVNYADGKWPVFDAGGVGVANLFVEADGSAVASPVTVDYDAMYQDALNAALAADGSVLRAVVELLLERDTQMTEAVANANSLGSLKASFPKPVTRQEFVQALKRKMR